jgi:hypothetical protein
MKTYRVIGPHKVDEHPPGSKFRTALPEWRERALIRGGHIEVVPRSAPKAKTGAKPTRHDNGEG